MRWTGPLFLILFGAALATLGGLAFWAEVLDYQDGKSRFVRLAELTDPATAAGWSTNRQTIMLLACDNALKAEKSLEMRYAGADVRQGVIDNCAAMAEALVEAMPTMSYAWFIRAQAAALMQDWVTMNTGLIRSAQVGRYEQWLAERRSALSETHMEHLEPATLASNQEDLTMLVRSRLGVASLARRYVAQPDFRERITTIVEVMSQDDQRQFLDNVRRAYANIRRSSRPSSRT